MGREKLFFKEKNFKKIFRKNRKHESLKTKFTQNLFKKIKKIFFYKIKKKDFKAIFNSDTIDLKIVVLKFYESNFGISRFTNQD